uniref:Uncharacterized protein n=2 Tax=unclassified Rosemountvirus TaxID=2738372 RepID=A0AAU8GJN4_9CAUD
MLSFPVRVNSSVFSSRFGTSCNTLLVTLTSKRTC